VKRINIITDIDKRKKEEKEKKGVLFDTINDNNK